MSDPKFAALGERLAETLSAIAPSEHSDSRGTYFRRYVLIPGALYIHEMLRATADKGYHSHAWDARSRVLHGWYDEHRPHGPNLGAAKFHHDQDALIELPADKLHRIADISPEGCWTLYSRGLQIRSGQLYADAFGLPMGKRG